MFKEFRKRMSRYGQYQGETMRKNTETFRDATWMNTPSVRPVRVHMINEGLPPTYTSIEEYEEPLWAHFEEHAKHNITGDEVDWYVTFKKSDIVQHPEIKVGTYISVPDANDIPQYWLVVHMTDDNMQQKCQVLKTNYIFKWVFEGKIYQVLGCQRYANSYNSGSWDADRTTMVDNITGAWIPTNLDSAKLSYNQRMMISDGDRENPICWQISKILTTTPVGLSKFSLTQETFDPTKDNKELGLCNYYSNGIEIVEANTDIDLFTITYTGSKPTVRVGSSKIFTANLPIDNHFDISWILSDGVNIYNVGYDNSTSVHGDYTITTTDRTLILKVTQNYGIVGTMLTITAHCANGDEADVVLEVVS